MIDRFNVKFVVEDNNGKIHVTKEYNIFECIKNNDFFGENEILENAEELISCDCTLNESNTQCDCENRFDEGKIIQMLQHTGPRDRMGKLIYEGDIIENQKGRFKVYFDTDTLQYRAANLKMFDDKLPETIEILSFLLEDYKSEIIGNIYENENLLKEIENGK